MLNELTCRKLHRCNSNLRRVITDIPEMPRINFQGVAAWFGDTGNADAGHTQILKCLPKANPEYLIQ